MDRDHPLDIYSEDNDALHEAIVVHGAARRVVYRCCGDRVHFVKQDLRAAIDEALSQNIQGQGRRASGAASVADDSRRSL